MPHGLHLAYLTRLQRLTLLKQAVYGLQVCPESRDTNPHHHHKLVTHCLVVCSQDTLRDKASC